MSIENLMTNAPDKWKNLKVNDVSAASGEFGALTVSSGINITGDISCTNLTATGQVNSSNLHVSIAPGSAMKIGNGAIMPSTNSTVIGNGAFDGIVSGTSNTLLGANTAGSLNGDNNVVVGDNSMVGVSAAHTANKCVVVGSGSNSGALVNGYNFIVIGSQSSAGEAGMNRIVLGSECTCHRDNTIAISNPFFNPLSAPAPPTSMGGYYVVEVGPENYGIIPVYLMPPP